MNTMLANDDVTLEIPIGVRVWALPHVPGVTWEKICQHPKLYIQKIRDAHWPITWARWQHESARPWIYHGPLIKWCCTNRYYILPLPGHKQWIGFLVRERSVSIKQ